MKYETTTGSLMQRSKKFRELVTAKLSLIVISVSHSLPFKARPYSLSIPSAELTMNIYFKIFLFSLPGVFLSLCTASGEEQRTDFFNGKDLKGWNGDGAYWSVKDGAIVGHSEEPVKGNIFIWSQMPVGDFHLSVDVKLTPAQRNAGIQFRSVSINERGQAKGYQADVGGGVWGKLYHEHGRRKLDWNDRGLEAVKHGDWNRYEILAVGDRIWPALNGKPCVAIKDPKGERSGQIAFQIHGGPPQTVHYRHPKLTHNPKVELVGLNEAELNAELKAPDDADSKPSAPE